MSDVRSDVFADLVGQRAVVAMLRGAAAGDGMTHAWLITGPPGSGRSVAARAFAAALQCDDVGCGMCDSCRQVAAGSHQSVLVERPEGLSISVDRARRLIRDAALAPVAANWQVLIIEDADRLTDQAANALLKAIEEPAPHTVFILCAPGPEDMPPTIRSRCRVVTLRLPAASDVADVLIRRDGVDPAMAHWVARAAQGHVGRAKLLATSESMRARRAEVLAVPSRLATLADCLATAADLIAMAESADGAAEDDDADGRTASRPRAADVKRARSKETRARRDVLDGALVDLAAWYRDVLAVQFGATDTLVHTDHSAAINRFAKSGPADATLRRIEAVLRCREVLAANAAPLLAVEQLTLALRAG